MVKVDYATTASSRGMFPRVVVRVPLDKPLISHFKIENGIQKVEYEGLPIVCFNCGKYGHYRELCQKICKCANEGNQNKEHQNSILNLVDPHSKENHEIYEPWMIVQRRP